MSTVTIKIEDDLQNPEMVVASWKLDGEAGTKATRVADHMLAFLKGLFARDGTAEEVVTQAPVEMTQ